jgi:hypothetical protein
LSRAEPGKWCAAVPVFGPTPRVALSFELDVAGGARVGLNLTPAEARDFAREMLRAADLVDDPARAKKGGGA